MPPEEEIPSSYLMKHKLVRPINRVGQKRCATILSMKTISTPISRKELTNIAAQKFGNLVKAVVDINKKIMVIDADLHSDEEAELLHTGSKQENLWGINLYPELTGEDFIEFDSMINVRPSANNKSRSVESEHIRKQIVDIVLSLIAL